MEDFEIGTHTKTDKGFRLRKHNPVVSVKDGNQEAVEYFQQNKDKEGLEVKHIDDIIGKGVFAKRNYLQGEFIVQYHGTLLTYKEGEEKMQTYAKNLGSYIFFFRWNSKKFSVDGTFSKRKGRYVNDAAPGQQNENAEMRQLSFRNTPFLALFAKRRIEKGEEIRYDYGVKDLPWREKKENQRKDILMNKGKNIVKDCYVKLEKLKDIPAHQQFCSQSVIKTSVPDPTVHRNPTPRLSKQLLPLKHDRSLSTKHCASLSTNASLLELPSIVTTSTMTDNRLPDDTNLPSWISKPSAVTSSMITTSTVPTDTNHSLRINIPLAVTFSITTTSTVPKDATLPPMRRMPLSVTALMATSSAQPKDTNVLSTISMPSAITSIVTTTALTTATHISSRISTPSAVTSMASVGTLPSDTNLPSWISTPSAVTSSMASVGTLPSDTNLVSWISTPSAVTSLVTDSTLPSDTNLLSWISTPSALTPVVTASALSKTADLSSGRSMPSTVTSMVTTNALPRTADLLSRRNMPSAVTSMVTTNALPKATDLSSRGSTPSTVISSMTTFGTLPSDTNLLSWISTPSAVTSSVATVGTLPSDTNLVSWKSTPSAVTSSVATVCTLPSDTNLVSWISTPSAVTSSVASVGTLPSDTNLPSWISTPSAVTSSVVNTGLLLDITSPTKVNVPSTVTPSVLHSNPLPRATNISTLNDTSVVMISATLSPTTDLRASNLSSWITMPLAESSSVTTTSNEYSKEKNLHIRSLKEQSSDLSTNTSAVIKSSCTASKAAATVSSFDHTRPDFFRCGVCNICFEELENYLEHKRIPCIESLNLDQQTILEDAEGENEELSCIQEKVTRSTNNLKIKKRPKRPCPYCSKFVSRLSKHLQTVHKDEKDVKKAIDLPKHLRDRMLQDLKKEGIFKANAEILKKDMPDESLLIQERSQSNKELAMCSLCKGVFTKHLMYRHKIKCPKAQETTVCPVACNMNTGISDTKYPDKYVRDILQRFHKDEVGDVIRNDDWIKQFGYLLFQNMEGSDKRSEQRVSLMSKLRRLARLFIEFRRLNRRDNKIVKSCMEMFDRKSMHYLTEAIVNMTTDESEGVVKNGLKVSMKYLVEVVCKAMQANFLIRKDDDKAAEMSKFQTILDLTWPSFFKNAEESVLKNRQTILRAPKRLPYDEDIVKLRQYTKLIIEQLSTDNYSLLNYQDFCQLRDALVTRLTLFNARRGGEPSRMKISEWSDAWSNKWVDQRNVEKINDDIEKKLICSTKVAYIQASKTASLVPILIPEDCWQGLQLITNSGTRSTVGINVNNTFVFPNTQSSLNHTTGWLSVSKLCKQAGLLHHINATDMRHYVATHYSLLDVLPNDRQYFYKHLGHSQHINENVYQCPPAIKEITHVGKILGNLDSVSENIIENGGIRDDMLDLDTDKRLQEDTLDIDTDDRLQENILEFLEKVAEDAPLLEVLDLGRLIEENEVETVPENLIPWSRIILDKEIQKRTKQYFTDDAWLSLQNTVNCIKPQVLKRKNSENQCIDIKVPRYDSNSCTNKVNDEDPSYNPSTEEIEENFDCDESQALKLEIFELQNREEKKKTTDTKRHIWLPEEDECVEMFFYHEINDVAHEGTKGPLQVGKKIQEFLIKFPSVLKDLPLPVRRDKIRAKVRNLRTKIRENYFKNLKKMTQ